MESQRPVVQRGPFTCLPGRPKRSRVRYARIVAFEPYEDGFGIMRDAQTAKPRTSHVSPSV